VFQFYPENSSQVELITAQAMKSGFTGGLVVDYPNSTKAKKFFLVLMTGGPQALPAALGVGAHDDVPNQVAFASKRFSYILWRERFKSINRYTVTETE
jgi:18S rRNA (guanine1575-N7)-methyltransferase